MKVLIPCRCCGGSGEVELTGVSMDVLTAVRAVGREITATELAKRMGTKVPAMANRLKRLADLLLLTTRPYGRKVFYRVAD